MSGDLTNHFMLNFLVKLCGPIGALPTSQAILIVGSDRELSHLISNYKSCKIVTSSSKIKVVLHRLYEIKVKIFCVCLFVKESRMLS